MNVSVEVLERLLDGFTRKSTEFRYRQGPSFVVGNRQIRRVEFRRFSKKVVKLGLFFNVSPRSILPVVLEILTSKQAVLSKRW
jgi:hypothetical protein